MSEQIHVGARDASHRLTLEDARNAVIRSVNDLFKNDYELFLFDAHERTIGQHFAHYLVPSFGAYHIDCEYNCDGHAMIDIYGAKTKLATLFEKKGIQRVYPDTIVHRRGKPVNLLVAELKRSMNRAGRKSDIAKLQVFTADDVPELGTAYRYDVGVFLDFLTGMHVWKTRRLVVRADWYAKGNRVNDSPDELVNLAYPDINW